MICFNTNSLIDITTAYIITQAIYPEKRIFHSRIADIFQICYTSIHTLMYDKSCYITRTGLTALTIRERYGNLMNTSESAENYLETILILSKCKPVVRSVDIAEELGFKKSSVSVAMKNLREKNHITVTKEGFIYLTDSGKAIADMIYERHELLSEWLIRLGVDPKVATEDACRIEHVISQESFDAIKKHIQ